MKELVPVVRDKIESEFLQFAVIWVSAIKVEKLISVLKIRNRT
jgi:hypothetical protein